MAKKTKNTKKNRRILFAVIALIVIVLVVGKKAGWIGAEELTKVSVQDVKIRDITEYVSASGKIQPEKEIIIAPDASGEIVGLFVKEGDSVKKGDLLLKINPDIYQSTVEKVSASTQNQAFSALLFLFREVLRRDLEEMEQTVRAKRGSRSAPQPILFVTALPPTC